MDFNEYQKQAMGTALPTALTPEYMLGNMAGECGEVMSAWAKSIRDEWPAGKLEEELRSELGGLLWQIAGVCEVFGLRLAEIAEYNLDELYSRKKRGVIGGSGNHR